MVAETAPANIIPHDRPARKVLSVLRIMAGYLTRDCAKYLEKASCVGGKTGSGRVFSVVFGFVFFAPDFRFFALANLLGLQQMQRQRNTHMEPFTAQAAANGKLQERKAGKIGKTHPRCPEFWSPAVWAIHRMPVFLELEGRSRLLVREVDPFVWKANLT